MTKHLIFTAICLNVTPAALSAAERAAASQPASAPAPTAVIAGEVREAATRVPLAGVAVHLTLREHHTLRARDTDAPARGAITAAIERDAVTDADGRFAMTDLPAGAAAVSFTEPAHETSQQNLDAPAGQKTSLVVYLIKARIDPYETVVRGKKDETQITRVVLSHDEIAKAPGSFGDPLRVVQDLPGVAQAPLVFASQNVRGTPGAESALLVDGLSLPAVYHYGIGPSVLAERMVDEIAFMPGGFGARYGRSIAGVTEIRLREPDALRFSGKISTDLLMTGVFFNIPLGERTSLSLAGRRSYIDLLAKPFVTGNGDPIGLPQFTDYQVRLHHRSLNMGSFDLLFFGSYDEFVMLRGNNPGFPSLSFHSIKPSWNWQITPKVSNRLTAIATYRWESMKGDGFSSADRQWQFALRDDLSLKLSPGVGVNLGVDAHSVEDRYRSNAGFIGTEQELPPIAAFISDFPGMRPPGTAEQLTLSTALYAEVELKAGPLKAVPSVRAELMRYADKIYPAVQPRLLARLALGERVELKASSGLYQKIPRLAFTMPGVGPFKPVTSWQNVLGIEWSITPAISVEATGYYNYLWNQTTADIDYSHMPPCSSADACRAATPAPTYATQQGRVFGGELFLRHKPYKGFFGWVSYALSRSERLGGPLDKWTLFNFDQTHVLSVVGSYKLPRGWQVGARFRLSSGTPYTPQYGIFDRGYYTSVNGPSRAARYPFFHELDVRIDKTWVYDTWQFTFYLDFINVYATPMALAHEYSDDFSSVRYRTQIIPPLPILGVQAEF